MELGTNICALRKSRDITQEELAAELGVTAAAVSKWEKGNTLPDVLMVCAIADFFEISTDELLGRNKELKKLVVIAGEDDRNRIEKILRNHGFCPAAWVGDFDSAKRCMGSVGAGCILRVSNAFMTEQEAKQAENCSYADCVYEEPEDLPGNLDTILSMLKKHL